MAVWLAAGCASPVAPHADNPKVAALIKPVLKPSAGQNVKTLVMWSFHQAKEFAFMQKLASRYHELHPDVEIKVEYIPSDDYFNGSRLLSAFAAGHGPDIFFVSAGNIKQYVDANIVQPLTAQFTPELKADFTENALDGVTINHDIYAVPFEVELLGLYYNKMMFADHHLSPPRTWADMEEDAKQLTTGTVSGLSIETFGSVYQNFVWLPFFWQSFADILNKDGTGSALNTPEAVQTYTYFQHLHDLGLLNLHQSRPTTDIGILANKETAMQVSGTWNIRALETTYADVPIGVVPLPVPDRGKPATIAGGWKMAVNRQSEEAAEETKFVMWAFAENTQNALEWCTDVKFAYSPPQIGHGGGPGYIP